MEINEIREIIYKYAVKNAYDYGKANEKAVLGKIFAEKKELRSRAKEILPLVKEVVESVNKLPRVKIEEEVKRFKYIEKKVEKGLKPLPDAENGVVMRFAPNPSGPLHIGHARAAILNDEYVKKYGGKLILRIEDTDPARILPEAYEMIEEDLSWLGVEYHEKVVQSDRLEIYYEHARKLIELGKAYVCTCKREEFQRLKLAKKACSCRNLGIEENLERYEKMFTEYREGEAVVRLKTDLAHKDPSVRDFVILRICEEEHPRVDARVYPLMNFSVAVDDHLLGITHVLRGKDHINNTIKQRYIYRYFGWKEPIFIHYGIMKIEGLALSTSKIRVGIEKGIYSGWDDVKLGTLRALKKRGISPEAIRRAMVEIGIKESDINFSWENLYAYNREIIEPKANRYFFVFDPKEVFVSGVKTKTYKALLHPSYKERGFRELKVVADNGTAKIYISADDFERIKEGEFLRLMDAFNIVIEKKEREKAYARYVSEDLKEARKKKAKLIQWVCLGVETIVFSPEREYKGLAEENLKKVPIDTVVQFERFGFVRIDRKNDKIIAYYAHK